MIPGRKHLVFEEGLQSAWLYETLNPHVDDIVVAGITESRGPRSDRRDAYALAEKLRVGNLEKPVFKAPRQHSRLRELSRAHMTLVSDVVRTQARIKSIYRSRGVFVRSLDVYGTRCREEWLKQLPSASPNRAIRLYDHLDFPLDQKKQADADRDHAQSLPNETAVLELLRPEHREPAELAKRLRRSASPRDALECRLGPDGRRNVDQGQEATDARAVTATQPLPEGHLRRGSDDRHHTTQQGSDPCPLRAASRRRHQAGAREALPGTNDRSDGAADVEGRGGVRPRTSRAARQDTRRPDDRSFERVDLVAVPRRRIREESSHATLCVAAWVSIHETPDRRDALERSHGQAMPPRRTERSDGRSRPRWKDGSHANVENTDARRSRCVGLTSESNPPSEPFENAQPLLGLNYEPHVSTRDRPTRTGADARIEESGADEKVRLALRPYGRRFKARFPFEVRRLDALTSRGTRGSGPIPGRVNSIRGDALRGEYGESPDRVNYFTRRTVWAEPRGPLPTWLDRKGGLGCRRGRSSRRRGCASSYRPWTAYGRVTRAASSSCIGALPRASERARSPSRGSA